ncbi:MAG TPA: radical SAM protein [Polyangiaceae bacterium]|nr:radical SAM protein [Polyangiaceae bacterium]
MRPLAYPLRVLQNQLGLVPRPSFCTFLVCNRCNARCGMCDSWRMPRGTELDVEQVRRVFRDIGSLDVVRLTGGEPFLRADLAELAEAVMAESAPGVLHITTNGSFPERVEQLAAGFSRPARLRVMVSFDGLAEVHDASRGRRVSFERALDSVQRLAALRARGVRVSVNHTIISRASLEDHAELRELLAALGVDTQWVLAYSESSMYGRERRGRRASDLVVLAGYPLHPDLDAAQALEFARGELERVGAIADPALRAGKRYYLAGLVARLEQQVEPRPKPKCVALRSHIRLLPNGDVPVCQFNTESLGNLLEEGFETLWHKAAAAAARRWVDACSGCWAECEVVPNALYSGDLLRHEARRLARAALRERRQSTA